MNSKANDAVLFLPGSLTKGRFKKIFHGFSRTKQREFLKKARIQRTSWVDQFNGDFFGTLKCVLGDPSNWKEYNIVAGKVEKKRSLLTIAGALSSFHLDQIKEQVTDDEDDDGPNFKSWKQAEIAEPDDYLSWFVAKGYFDCSAEYIWWLFGEKIAALNSKPDLMEALDGLTKETSGLRETVQPMRAYLEQEIKTKKIKETEAPNPTDETENGWDSQLTQLQKLVNNLSPETPNLEIATEAYLCCEHLVQIAEKIAEETPDFSELETVLEDLAKTLCSEWKLEQPDVIIAKLEASDETLNREQVDALVEELRSIIPILQDRLQKISLLKETIANEVIPGKETIEDLRAEAAEFQQLARQSLSAIKVLVEKTEQETTQAEDSMENPPANADSGSGKPTKDTPSVNELVSEAGSPKKKPLIETDAIDEAAELDDPGITTTQDLPIPEAVSESSSTHQSDDKVEELLIQETAPQSLLLSAFSEGNFALSYWLCSAGNPETQPFLINPALPGAVTAILSQAEDETPEPRLRGFLRAISEIDHFGKEEQILASVSMVTTAVLSAGNPANIDLLHTLANCHLQSDVEALNQLNDFVVDKVIRRGWIPRRESLQTDLNRPTFADRFCSLSTEAKEFQDGLKNIRFNYPPAHTALLELFSPESEFRTMLEVVISGEPADEATTTRKAAMINAALKRIDPNDIANNLKEYTSVEQQIQGPVRSQITNKLLKALQFAEQWSGLVAELSARGSQGEQAQLDKQVSLNKQLRTHLRKCKNALAALKDSNKLLLSIAEGAAKAIEHTYDILQGNKVDSLNLDSALLMYAKLPLDNSLHPFENDHQRFYEYIADGSRSPEKVITSCLKRHEFYRARVIANQMTNPDEWITKIDSEASVLTKNLEQACIKTKGDVEEANLLGLTTDEFSYHPDSSPGNTDDSSFVDETAEVSQNFSRDTLLSQLTDCQLLIQLFKKGEIVDLRVAEEILSQVTSFVRDKKRQRQKSLKNKINKLLPKLNLTPEGKNSDKSFTETEMSNFLNSEDNVALAELHERVEKAVRNNELLDRWSNDANTRLEEFFDQYNELEALGRQRNLSDLVKAIKTGQNIHGLNFARRDNAHLDRALKAVEGWNQLRTKRAYEPSLNNHLESILRLIGIVDSGKLHNIGQPQDDVVQFEIDTSDTLQCPIPAFGSSLDGKLRIILMMSKRQPRDIVELARKNHTSKSGVLVIHKDSLSAKQRLQIRQHCIRKSIACAVLDFPLVASLCGSRDPLISFFQIALPLTWSQPYMMAGDRVSKEVFVGRERQITELKDPDGSCIVYGGRQLGKSALLRHLATEHHAPEDGLFIAYRDVDDLGNAPQDHAGMKRELWMRIYIETKHIGFIQNEGTSQKVTLNNAWKVVPELIRKRLDSDRKSRLILLLDEVDDLLDKDVQNDFEVVTNLRQLMTNTNKRFKVVLTGLKSVQRFASYQNQPFAHLGNACVITPLPPKSAQQLVLQPMEFLGFKFEKSSLILRILAQANYHPGLVQIFCYRLLENLNAKSRLGSNVQTITRQDINQVERNADFMEEIRARFDWTLDLDERYKVLVYALVMETTTSVPHTVRELWNVGKNYWKEVFGQMDEPSIRGLLEELEGLGVLQSISEDNQRRYRLKNQNLLRLLGSKEDIVNQLLFITEKDKPNTKNPNNFHKLISTRPRTFSPFTMEQDAQISGKSEHFRLCIVYGSNALGIQQVPKTIGNLMDSLSVLSPDENEWQGFSIPNIQNANSAAKFISRKFRPNKRKHLYGIIDLSSLSSDFEPVSYFNTLLAETSRTCHGNSKGRIFLLAGEEVSWKLIRSEPFQRQVARREDVDEIYLKRWSDGAIWQALEDLGFKTKAINNAETIFASTCGLNSITQLALQKVGKKAHAIDKKLLKTALENAIESAKNADDFYGISIVDESLRDFLESMLELLGSEVCQQEWETALNLISESHPEFIDDNGKAFRKWFTQALGIARTRADSYLEVVPFASDIVH